jgi:hypothetical protein
MMPLELTRTARLATIPAMAGQATLGGTRAPRRASLLPLAALGTVLVGLGGCVNVRAPDKPIVIELNVNIRQEVIYRLAADAGNTIDENKDIF